jgi:hypothetical protein
MGDTSNANRDNSSQALARHPFCVTITASTTVLLVVPGMLIAFTVMESWKKLWIGTEVNASASSKHSVGIQEGVLRLGRRCHDMTASVHCSFAVAAYLF